MRKADPDLHRRRREEILAAAESCFVQRGFHASSMQDIAAASGVSMGLLYRYFTNKEAIIETAAMRERAQAVGLIAAVSESGDCALAWATTILKMADVASEPEYMRLTNEIIAEAGRTPKLLATLQEFDAGVAAAISDKLSTQQVAGNIPADVNIALAVEAMLLLLEGTTARNMLALPSKGNGRSQLIAKMVAAILH